MSSFDVVDVVRFELFWGQSDGHGAVVSKRADRRMRSVEMASQSGEPDGVEDPVEGETLAVELGGDGPVLTAGAVRRVGGSEVGFEQAV